MVFLETNPLKIKESYDDSYLDTYEKKRTPCLLTS